MRGSVHNKMVGNVGALWRKCCLAVCLLVAPSFVWSYAVKVEVTMAKNSAGEKLPATMPVSTKISPCNAALGGKDKNPIDAINIKITYDLASSTGAKVVDRDLYVIFYNPDNDPKYLTAINPAISIEPRMFRAYRTIIDLDNPAVKDQDPYLPREKNFLKAGTVELIPGGVAIDGVIAGTWQVIAIAADRTNPAFSLDEPSTWSAWDVATVMFGRPWVGRQAGRICL